MNSLRNILAPRKATKACPHPYCWHAHAALTLCMVTFFVSLLVSDLSYILYTLACGVVIECALKLLFRGKVPHMHDFPGTEATDKFLVVRPWWARLAIALDALFVFGFGFMLITEFSDGDIRMKLGEDSASSLPPVLTVSICVLALYFYAHRKATEPAKPKHSTVPQPTGA